MVSGSQPEEEYVMEILEPTKETDVETLIEDVSIDGMCGVY